MYGSAAHLQRPLGHSRRRYREDENHRLKVTTPLADPTLETQAGQASDIQALKTVLGKKD